MFVAHFIESAILPDSFAGRTVFSSINLTLWPVSPHSLPALVDIDTLANTLFLSSIRQSTPPKPQYPTGLLLFRSDNFNIFSFADSRSSSRYSKRTPRSESLSPPGTVFQGCAWRFVSPFPPFRFPISDSDPVSKQSSNI